MNPNPSTLTRESFAEFLRILEHLQSRRRDSFQDQHHQKQDYCVTIQVSVPVKKNRTLNLASIYYGANC